MAYGDFKDLPRRIASEKVLRDNEFNIAKNPKYDGYQRGLSSIVYNLFDEMSDVAATSVTRADKSAIRAIMSNYQQQAQRINCTNQSSNNLKNLKYNHLLKKMYGV